jgi:autotransporter-associated beta strand protein
LGAAPNPLGQRHRVRDAMDAGIANNTGGNFSMDGGTQTLSGANTYTGQTTILLGTLALTGTDSISQSSDVTVGTNFGNATFDISGTTSGATIVALFGASDGTVNLGTKTLTITNASSGNQFNGAINGSGGLTIAGGAQVLGGINGYTASLKRAAAFVALGLIFDYARARDDGCFRSPDLFGDRTPRHTANSKFNEFAVVFIGPTLSHSTKEYSDEGDSHQQMLSLIRHLR